MLLLTYDSLVKLLQKHTLSQFTKDLIDYLKEDFRGWEGFIKMPRPAFHFEDSVIELMPICNAHTFSYKYVNGHPNNPSDNKRTCVATGQLSTIKDGYPYFISEMTLLTALRTAATSALASDLLAPQNAKTIAMIGTGAQSEFQVLAHLLVREINSVRFHDIDLKAMKKFHNNMKQHDIKLIPCGTNEEAVAGADIVIVCTACKKHVDVIHDNWIKPGVHINGLGGDCPGKTEIEISLLKRANVIVEYFDQSFIEGEIQRFSLEEAKTIVHAELKDIIQGTKTGRKNKHEITLFDAVGFAIEDFSALRLTYDLCKKYGVGDELPMMPPDTDPKNLYSTIEKRDQDDEQFESAL